MTRTKSIVSNPYELAMVDHFPSKGEEDTYPIKVRWPVYTVNVPSKGRVANAPKEYPEGSITVELGTNVAWHSNYLDKDMNEGANKCLNLVSADSDALDKLAYFFREIAKPKCKIVLNRYFATEEDYNKSKVKSATLCVGRSKVELDHADLAWLQPLPTQ